MRRWLPLALAALVAAGCGSGKQAAPTQTIRRAPFVRVDLAAAARKLLAARTARVVYDLGVDPPRSSPLQFVTHAIGDVDLARGAAAYVATTPLGEGSRTVVIGRRRWTRSLGGGAAGAGNAPTAWHLVPGPDLSPAGGAALAPLAAAQVTRARRIGRWYEARISVARAPVRARAFLRGTFGAEHGVADFALDGGGRLVAVRLRNDTALSNATLLYTYAYSRLGVPVHIRPPTPS